MALQWLRDKLKISLNQNNIEIIDEWSDIGEFQAIELAIIASHGGTGVGGYFTEVSDRISDFSAERFALGFRGTGCVVLFVCSAGVANQQFMTAEALGLVSSLLRASVRCVVACPWPLRLELPVLWCESFLSAFRAGETVAISAFQAAQKVRASYPNPCAWTPFHVYGDGTFTAAKAQVTNVL